MLNEVKVELTDDEKYLIESIISVINYLLNKFRGARRSLEYVLEILTSLHFAYKYSGMPRNKSEIINRLNEVKPELQVKDLYITWDVLEKIGLI